MSSGWPAEILGFIKAGINTFNLQIRPRKLQEASDLTKILQLVSSTASFLNLGPMKQQSNMVI